MTDYVSLYATFPNQQEAKKIIDALLEARLIACANLSSDVTSYYRWEGKREQASECSAIMKTTADKQSQATALITKLHSYDCPSVVVWPILDGHPHYLEWIKHETSLP